MEVRAVMESFGVSQPSGLAIDRSPSFFERGFRKLLQILDLPPPHQISLDQMKPVAAATRMATAGHAFNTTVVALALMVNGINLTALAWMVMSLGIAYHVEVRARRNSHLRQKTSSHKALSQRAVKKAFLFGVILALPWGLLPVLFFDPAQHLTTMVIIALVAGMSASGAISLAPVYPAAFAYVLTTVLPTFFVLLFHIHVFEFALLACVALCYGAFLISLIAVIARISIGASQKTAQLNYTLVRICQATKNIEEARAGPQAWREKVNAIDSELPVDNADVIVETLNKSARKMVRQKHALQRSEEKLSRLLHTAMDAIVSIDKNQFVLSVNSAAEDMFGVGVSVTEPTMLADFLREDSLQSILAQLGRIRTLNRTEGKPKESGVLIEAVGRRGNGHEFPIEISVAMDEASENATLIMRDVSERKTSEENLRVLMMEVNHRSRNLMAVLNSIMQMTASRSKSIREFVDGFGMRLKCLLRSHEIIMRDDWGSSHIRALLATQLSASLPEYEMRVRLVGPEIELTPKAMQNLGLALHELSTNAMKYGALSVPEGKVEINWRVAGPKADQKLYLIWRETGGPESKLPKRKGFGTILLQQILGPDLDGQSALKYRSTGLTWQAQIGSGHYQLA